MKKPRLTDQQLVENFQQCQSEESFDALYNQYVNKVYRTCLNMTKDSESAKDYTQDIFVKVFEHVDTFQNRASFSTWLYRVAYNHCLDRLRLGKRLPTESIDSDEYSFDVADNATDFGQDSDRERIIQAQEAALRNLPTCEQTLLRLKYEQGLSIQAISQQLHLSESAVKMRLKRSRDKLMQHGPSW